MCFDIATSGVRCRLVVHGESQPFGSARSELISISLRRGAYVSQVDAEQATLPQIVEWIQLVRVHLLFVQRKWDILPAALDRSRQVAEVIPAESSLTWHQYFHLHHLMYLALWQGRMGKDDAVKKASQVDVSSHRSDVRPQFVRRAAPRKVVCWR